MSNVIQLDAATTFQRKSSTANWALDAGSGFAASKLEVLNRKSLGAIFLGIDAICATLDFIQKICDALADGPRKDLLKQQKRQLAFELFEVRMIAIRLSSGAAAQRTLSASTEVDRLPFAPMRCADAKR